MLLFCGTKLRLHQPLTVLISLYVSIVAIGKINNIVIFAFRKTIINIILYGITPTQILCQGSRTSFFF